MTTNAFCCVLLSYIWHFQQYESTEFLHDNATVSLCCVADQRDVALNDIQESRSSCKELNFLSDFNRVCFFLGIFK